MPSFRADAVCWSIVIGELSTDPDDNSLPTIRYRCRRSAQPHHARLRVLDGSNSDMSTVLDFGPADHPGEESAAGWASPAVFARAAGSDPGGAVLGSSLHQRVRQKWLV